MLNSLNLLNKMLWQENKTDPNFHEHDSNFKLEKLCVIKNSPNKCGTNVEIAANVYWKSIQSQISMYFSGRRINVRWHLKKTHVRCTKSIDAPTMNGTFLYVQTKSYKRCQIAK